MKNLLFGLLSCAAIASSALAQELKIVHLGANNSLVRIEKPSPVILLPVQENAPLASIRVLSNGNLIETINIALANNKVDYYVPLHLGSDSSNKILLDIRTNHDRSNVREAMEAVWCNELHLGDSIDVANKERFRPFFHHTPTYGWMNDPNGMFYKDGTWHLYYQWNPYGSKWQNMTWGHSTSKDLVNWEPQPTALKPDALGMVFSGSCVIDSLNTAGFGKNAIIALYTSADASQTQSLAYSLDGGYTFNRYDGNPVITYEKESRDPNMFWDETHKQWVLLLANAQEHEMLFYTSPNLIDWQLVSSFGKGYGAQNGEWECPDLLRLPIEGTDEEKWVLLCNINPGSPAGGSGTQYFVGDFDGTSFTCIDAPETEKWLDFGKDHYAAVSFSNAPDNRATIIAWMSNWQYANDVPTMQFRSANTLPRDLSLFKDENGNLFVAVRPASEIDKMRLAPKAYSSGGIGGKYKMFSLPDQNDGICEIDLTVSFKSADAIELELVNDAGECVKMTLSSLENTFTMDRSKSGEISFSEQFPAQSTAPTFNNTTKYGLRIFVDKSSIEVFDKDGRFAMTNIVFPAKPYSVLKVKALNGTAKIDTLKVYPLDMK